MRRSTSNSVSSFDPQLFKYLVHHHKQFEPSVKEYLQDGFYYNSLPPNTVATNFPRHLLGNGLSKLNTENSILNQKLSSINEKVDQQDLSNDCYIKKCPIQQSKETFTFDQWLQPPIGSIIQGPPCLQSDTSSSSSATNDFKTETILSSGERITCFVIGGENRLCLPSILNTVLKDFSLQEINNACSHLHIYCSRCTNEQISILKLNKILPINASSCGLITQTDAERLCANLFKYDLINSISLNEYKYLYSIKVEHKCFGKSFGKLYPILYIKLDSKCIECDICQILFSPKIFVSHGHKSKENKICHWGFNSDNWRFYLKIRSTEDKNSREEFNLFKKKFLNNNLTQKKRSSQSLECLIPREKRLKLIPTSSDIWSTNNIYPYFQRTFSSIKKDNHLGEYSFACPNLIPPSFPIESVTTSNSYPRSSPLRVVRSISPVSNESTNPSITNYNDFSPSGIQEIVDSTISSLHGRYQLLRYISELQLSACAYSSKINCLTIENEQNEINLLRRENEYLREHLSKLEKSKMSSNSNMKNNENEILFQQNNIIEDLDDLESNISLNSLSSINQTKYFNKKRYLLSSEILEKDLLITKKSNHYKKVCLDQIVDSLSQKAQAEQEENIQLDQNLLKQKDKILTTNNNLISPSTTIEREDQHIDDDQH